MGLVPNCPMPNCPGAKLSWCQIVLVPNCPLLLSWCQIVCFYYLGAKLSPLLSWCQIVRCQIVRCQIVLQSKSGTIFFISNIYIPKMKNKKKRSFILMRTQIGFNLKCIAQCICSKSSGLTFFGQYLDFYKNRCVIGYGYEVGKLRFKHIHP